MSSIVSALPARRSGESASTRAPARTSPVSRSGARRAIASAQYPPIEAPQTRNGPSTSSSTPAAHSSIELAQPIQARRDRVVTPERLPHALVQRECVQ